MEPVAFRSSSSFLGGEVVMVLGGEFGVVGFVMG